MNTYRYVYNSFVDSIHINDLADIPGYLRTIGGELVSVQVFDMTGTDFAREQARDFSDMTAVLRVVTTGTVQAAHSQEQDASLPWDGSAEAVVEEGSFATTDSWDVGVVHLLSIRPIEDDEKFDLGNPLLNGEQLPMPVRTYTAKELAAITG